MVQDQVLQLLDSSQTPHAIRQDLKSPSLVNHTVGTASQNFMSESFACAQTSTAWTPLWIYLSQKNICPATSSSVSKTRTSILHSVLIIGVRTTVGWAHPHSSVLIWHSLVRTDKQDLTFANRGTPCGQLGLDLCDCQLLANV